MITSREIRNVTGLSHGSGGWLGRRPFLYDDPVYAGAFPTERARVRARLDDLMGTGRIRLAALPRSLDHSSSRGVGHLDADRVRGIPASRRT